MKKQLAAMLVFLIASLTTNVCGQTKPDASGGQSNQTQARTSPVQVGEMAPDFTLEDFRVENEEWRKITLAAARERMPVVLVFYRGHW